MESFKLTGEDNLLYRFQDLSLQFVRITNEEEGIEAPTISKELVNASLGWNKVSDWPSIVLTGTQMKIIEVDLKDKKQSKHIWSSNPLHQNQLKTQFPQELNLSEANGEDLSFKFQVS